MRALLVACSLLVACKKDSDAPKRSEPAASEKSESDEPSAKSKKTANADEGQPAALKVEGLGQIPAWSADKGGAKACSSTAAAKASFKTLVKGEGAVDGAALQKELAGECKHAERELAEALNTGGYTHYKKKHYAEANRWWREALVVKPSFVMARYNLACGLALDGKTKSALAQLGELARATRDGDATAANFLEKAKSDEDLAAVRDEPQFKKAIAASAEQGSALVGPRKEPELSPKVVKLFPEDFQHGKNGAGTDEKYKPALLQVWTWRPDEGVELLVATAVHDPSTLGQPKGDLNHDYGAIVVFKRAANGEVELLALKKTGEAPPVVAAGASKTVAYSFYEMCGDLRGTLAYKAGKVIVQQKACSDLGNEPETNK